MITIMKWRLVKNHIALNKNCKTRFAKIFQGEGDYCLTCWQEHTYPVN